MCGDALRTQEEGGVHNGKLEEDKKERMADSSEEVVLKRELGLFSAISLIISVMIGELKENYKLLYTVHLL